MRGGYGIASLVLMFDVDFSQRQNIELARSNQWFSSIGEPNYEGTL